MLFNKLAKLKRMSLPEIKQRVLHQVHVSQERRVWRKSGCRLGPASIDVDRVCLMVKTLCPGFALMQAQQLQKASGDDLGLSAYRMLGHDFDLTGDVDWHKDPCSGYRWPETFYEDLKLYNLGNGVDIKYPWELSRHQYFVPILLQATPGSEPASADRVRDFWLDWIDKNPVYQGVNWTSGLEAAMRSISWIWTLAAIDPVDQIDNVDLEKIVQSLVDHASYLEHHFSYYSSPYNHLIGEATALYLLGSLLEGHPQASKWGQQATQVLQDYGPKQFYEDGFCVEQATSYHFYTLGFLVLAITAARRWGSSLKELEAVVHHAFQAGLKFRRPDGRWPAVGDLDSARALPVQPTDFWNFDGLCHCAAVLFEDSALARIGDTPGRELTILMGPEGLERWRALRSDDPVSRFESNRQGASSLQDAGYVVASADKDWMLFDAGPIAKGLFPDATPSTAHGHADTLQVLYSIDGEPLLEDSGIPFYNGDPEWIRYFRSPAAHNTVEIEGAELVRSEGRLAWSREVSRPTLTSSLSKEAWLCGGKLEWPGVTHERYLFGQPGVGLWIADWIQAKTPRRVAWYWQLPASANLSNQGNVLAGWGDFAIKTWNDQVTSELIHTTKEKPHGWRCHGYRQQSPGSVLIQRDVVEGQSLSLTYIGRAERPLVNVQVHDHQRGDANDHQDASAVRQLGACTWQQSCAVGADAAFLADLSRSS